MKSLKIIVAVLLTFSVFSCKQSSEKKEVKTETVAAANLQTLNLDIEGMTCEIGCAKTIESKISKIEGVTASKVNFEKKKGIFTYDGSKTSEEKIIATVNNLIDGKTYHASKCKQHCELDGKKDCKPGCEKACCTTKEKAHCEPGCKKACCTLEKEHGEHQHS